MKGIGATAEQARFPDDAGALSAEVADSAAGFFYAGNYGRNVPWFHQRIERRINSALCDQRMLNAIADHSNAPRPDGCVTWIGRNVGIFELCSRGRPDLTRITTGKPGPTAMPFRGVSCFAHCRT